MRTLLLTAGLALVAACGARIADPTAKGGGDDDNQSVDAPGGNGHLDAAVDAPADAAPDATPDARMCTGTPDGEGHCYTYHATAENWMNAQTACIGEHAHLAIIDDAKQNATVQSLIGTTNPAFIGATDAAVENTFLWIDGTALTFKNFDAGEPNNGGGNGYQEDCLVMRSDGAKAGKWDDRPCAIESGAGTAGVYPFVCEYSL